MDEFKELSIEELTQFLNDNFLEYETAQKGLCFAIIKRMHKRLMLGYRFKPIRVCRYRNIVVDGNHTYIAYSIAGIPLEEFDGTSCPSDISKPYRKMEVDFDDDWDDNSEVGRKHKSDEHLLELRRIIVVK